MAQNVNGHHFLQNFRFSGKRWITISLKFSPPSAEMPETPRYNIFYFEFFCFTLLQELGQVTGVKKISDRSCGGHFFFKILRFAVELLRKLFGHQKKFPVL